MTERKQSIAILGAGPIGLEAALHARMLGYDVTVLEREGVAENVRRWGFVRLFSPWSMNVSTLGLETLRSLGRPEPRADVCPTGREFHDEYLHPIAASLGDRIRTHTLVRGVARSSLLKGDNPGDRSRGRAPFRILLEDATGVSDMAADIVIDATGVYGNPSCLGDGGIPALGETTLRGFIDYQLPDVLGVDRLRFEGRATLLVGAGLSALTTLSSLVHLARQAPSTRVIWARRTTGPDPFPIYSEDPLPERARLAVEGNQLAAKPPPALQVISGVTVGRLTPIQGKIRVEFRPVEGGGIARAIEVDRIVAQVGFRPDLEVFRELQVHQCYATEGPMALAAALPGASGRDCLKQKSPGVETLRNPEPGFFVVGQKSYGRRNDFLLRVGREQVRGVFGLLEGSFAAKIHDTSGATLEGVTASARGGPRA